MLGDPGPDGRRDHAPAEQGDDEIESIPVEGEQEGDGNGEGDEELGCIGRADRIAWRNPPSDERGCGHRPPTAATDGIQKAGHPAERMTRRTREAGLTTRPRTSQQQNSSQQQVNPDKGLEQIAVEIAEQPRPDRSTDHARQNELEENLSIEIFEPGVRHT